MESTDKLFNNVCIPYCQKVLPLVYDDSLSYYEVLCKLTGKINELITYIENFEENVADDVKVYTDEQIELLRGALTQAIEATKNELDIRVDLVVEDVDDKYRQLSSAITTNYAMLDNKINQHYAENHTKFNEYDLKIIELNTSMTRLYIELGRYKNQVDYRISQMYNDLLEYITEHLELGGNIFVVNPITSSTDTLQHTLDMLYVSINVGGVTAREYDSLQFTAYDFQLQGLTAMEYDTNARFVWFKRLFLTIASPFTGLLSTIETVINQLADLHKDTLTALEYDTLELTAEVYDMKDITAYDYDWKAGTVLRA